MKKNSLRSSRLYVVIAPEDAARAGLAVEDAARQAALGGADIVQLRDKDADEGAALERARRVAGALRDLGALFIVNDRPETARRVGADGVHLGQDDMPHAEARRLLGPHFIIGRSTHSLDQVLAAEGEGADYVGYGPIFATPTKPDTPAVGPDSIGPVAQKVAVPFFAIGGINLERLEAVVRRGAKRVAVVRAAFRDRSVLESVSRLKKDLLKHDAHDF